MGAEGGLGVLAGSQGGFLSCRPPPHSFPSQRPRLLPLIAGLGRCVCLPRALHFSETRETHELKYLPRVLSLTRGAGMCPDLGRSVQGSLTELAKAAPPSLLPSAVPWEALPGQSWANNSPRNADVTWLVGAACDS